MTSRSAEATIKGYYYQFDSSILNLLDLKNGNDSIVVEGIEDIDIITATDTTAVQCKYLSKPKYINSAVKDPIILMIDHSTKNPLLKIKYILYAHFENETGDTEYNINLSTLKEILTYKVAKLQKSYHLDNGITDTDLNNFLSRFKLIFGKKFEVQQHEVISKLKAKFGCSDYEADSLHYNNALRIIIDKAVLTDINKRKLSQSDFFNSLSSSKKLFNEWYIRLKSKKEYLKAVADNIKLTKSNMPSKSKYLFIGSEVLKADNSEMPAIRLIENLIHKYYQLGTSLRNAKPPVIILETDKITLKEIKIGLIKEQIHFNDGHEEICFDPSFFNCDPIINVNKAGNKVIKSSYMVKIVSVETIIKHLTEIHQPKVVISCSKTDCVYAPSNEYQLFDIKHCENLKDILSIL